MQWASVEDCLRATYALPQSSALNGRLRWAVRATFAKQTCEYNTQLSELGVLVDPVTGSVAVRGPREGAADRQPR